MIMSRDDLHRQHPDRHDVDVSTTTIILDTLSGKLKNWTVDMDGDMLLLR